MKSKNWLRKTEGRKNKSLPRNELMKKLREDATRESWETLKKRRTTKLLKSDKKLKELQNLNKMNLRKKLNIAQKPLKMIANTETKEVKMIWMMSLRERKRII